MYANEQRRERQTPAEVVERRRREKGEKGGKARQEAGRDAQFVSDLGRGL